MDRLYDRCLRCNRKLKDDEAKRIGYGKICLEKSKTSRVINLLEVENEEGQETNKRTKSNNGRKRIRP